MLSVLPQHNIAPHSEGIVRYNLQIPFFFSNVYYIIILYIHTFFLPLLPPFNNNNNKIFRCITNKVSTPIVIAWNGTVQNGMSCMVTHISENDKNGRIIHATDNTYPSHENVLHQPSSVLSASSSSSDDIPRENSQAIKHHNNTNKNYDAKNYRKNALVENLVGKRLIKFYFIYLFILYFYFIYLFLFHIF
jgi:hypothetical protein